MYIKHVHVCAYRTNNINKEYLLITGRCILPKHFQGDIDKKYSIFSIQIIDNCMSNMKVIQEAISGARLLDPSSRHSHDDVMKWKHFPHYWPFVRGIHRSPAQRPVTRSFDIFFHLRLNKRLSKQSWGWWFETLSRLLWRHSKALWMHVFVVFLIHDWRSLTAEFLPHSWTLSHWMGPHLQQSKRMILALTALCKVSN